MFQKFATGIIKRGLDLRSVSLGEVQDLALDGRGSAIKMNKRQLLVWTQVGSTVYYTVITEYRA